jgi:hypothetical protein
MHKISAAVATLLLTSFYANSAFAFSFWDCVPVPEIDAGSGLAAVALVMSIGAVLHNKIRRR